MERSKPSTFDIIKCNEYGRSVAPTPKVDHDFGWPSATPESASVTPTQQPAPQEQDSQGQQQ